jgi:gluconolactonase
MRGILRDAGLSELIESDEPRRLAGGFQFTEGPLWCRDGSLLFQDIKAERTDRLSADGSLQVLRERNGAANGQTFVAGGSIVFCE